MKMDTTLGRDTLKTYYGHAATTERPASVMVRDQRPQALAHHVRHSPTGFNWGYGGSGPSELSRCILLDSFGITECPFAPKECQCQSSWVEPTYQGFLSDVVSKLAKDEDWKLYQQDIADWVFDYLGRVKEELPEGLSEGPPGGSPVPAGATL